eukprot:2158_1
MRRHFQSVQIELFGIDGIIDYRELRSNHLSTHFHSLKCQTTETTINLLNKSTRNTPKGCRLQIAFQTIQYYQHAGLSVNECNSLKDDCAWSWNTTRINALTVLLAIPSKNMWYRLEFSNVDWCFSCINPV